MARTAVVLFNLGGPDRLESVRPFLFNLFYDPAITEMAAPFRWLFAKLITARREKAVQANYALMGGKTPLLAETLAQMQALQAALADPGAGLGEIRCFMAMRYWHPLSEAAVARGCSLATRSHPAAAALPAVLGRDHGLVAGGMAPGRARRRARRPDPGRLLLSARGGVRPRRMPP